jgi:hypothetical protein
MSEDIKKMLDEKDKIYQRVLDLLEKKASILKIASDVGVGGQLKPNIIMTPGQAMNSNFDHTNVIS